MKGNTAKQFDTLISESMKIGIEKMSKYGTSWTSYRPKSLLTRIFNKGKRISVILETGENKVGESVTNEFKDILNYCVIAIILLEGNIKRHSDLEAKEINLEREKVFQKAKELMHKKNHDYGEAWRDMEQDDIVDEINVKIHRSLNMLKVREKPMDNIYDVINYCAFALILIDEGKHNK